MGLRSYVYSETVGDDRHCCNVCVIRAVHKGLLGLVLKIPFLSQLIVEEGLDLLNKRGYNCIFVGDECNMRGYARFREEPDKYVVTRINFETRYYGEFLLKRVTQYVRSQGKRVLLIEEMDQSIGELRARLQEGLDFKIRNNSNLIEILN